MSKWAETLSVIKRDAAKFEERYPRKTVCHTHIKCAMCGTDVRVSNDDPTRDALILRDDGRLYLNCPVGCRYELPFVVDWKP